MKAQRTALNGFNFKTIVIAIVVFSAMLLIYFSCMVHVGSFLRIVDDIDRTLPYKKLSVLNEEKILLYPEFCARDETNSVFEEWYNNNSSNNGITYRNNILESLSGPGSSMRHTFDTVNILKTFFNAHKDITSVADIPCGDTNWQFSVKELNTISVYFGGDVSSLAVNNNIEKYKDHKNKIFAVWDLTSCTMPQYQMKSNGNKYDFDLVISRDVIQHLSLQKGLKFIQTIIQSNVTYFAVTTYPSSKLNKGAFGRGYYENNLEIEPFNLNCNHEGIVCLIKKPSHKTFPHGKNKLQKNNGDSLIIYQINDALKKIVSSYDV